MGRLAADISIAISATVWALLQAHWRHLDVAELSFERYTEGVLRTGLGALSGSRTGEPTLTERNEKQNVRAAWRRRAKGIPERVKLT